MENRIEEVGQINHKINGEKDPKKTKIHQWKLIKKESYI